MGPKIESWYQQFVESWFYLPIKSIPTKSRALSTFIGINSGACVLILLNSWHRWHDLI